MLPLFEQCVDTVPDAVNAGALGADRIELCSRLDLDGLSPDPAHVDQLLEELVVPIFAMVRPRAGDFHSSASEVDAMIVEIERLRRQGVHGLVLGVLDSAREIDVGAITDLVAAAGPLPVTFHRAFDQAPDAFAALEQLVELGVARILTSGQAATAPEGSELLRELVQAAGDRITIIAGGGVRPRNVAQLIEHTGVREVHASVPLNLRADASRHRFGSPDRT